MPTGSNNQWDISQKKYIDIEIRNAKYTEAGKQTDRLWACDAVSLWRSCCLSGVAIPVRLSDSRWMDTEIFGLGASTDIALCCPLGEFLTRLMDVKVPRIWGTSTQLRRRKTAKSVLHHHYHRRRARLIVPTADTSKTGFASKIIFAFAIGARGDKMICGTSSPFPL